MVTFIHKVSPLIIFVALVSRYVYESKSTPAESVETVNETKVKLGNVLLSPPYVTLKTFLPDTHDELTVRDFSP